MTAAELTRMLHQLIPLTHAMAVEVTALSDEGLTLTAPLAANRNHAGSAFAGSLYSLASAAGWAFLQQTILCAQLRAELVLADGHIRYRSPIHQHLTAELQLRLPERRRFLTRLQQGSRASIRLSVGLPSLDQPAAWFEGLYIATAINPSLPEATPG